MVQTPLDRPVRLDASFETRLRRPQDEVEARVGTL